MEYNYSSALNREAEYTLKDRWSPRYLRMQTMTALPDLTRKENSPVRFVVDTVRGISSLKGHDSVVFPEIVPVSLHFDALGFPPDHASRRDSDTFYVDRSHVLRAHTTAMWGYYLKDANVLGRLEKQGSLTALSYGKVYRNDEIDRTHYPVFHQIDGLALMRNTDKTLQLADLEAVLSEIAVALYGGTVSHRFSADSFPFTTPSIQLEVERDGQWLEVCGAGLVNPEVLTGLGLDPRIYNGWAFGLGVDRLAMLRMKIPDIRILWSNDERITRQFTSLDSIYHEISKFPPTDRDISLLVSETVHPNSFYEIVRDYGYIDNENCIEEVRLLDRYTNPAKFGEGRVSFTFRIRYRSPTRTFKNEEINEVQSRLRERVAEELGAQLR